MTTALSDFDLVLGVVDRMGDTEADFTDVTPDESAAISRKRDEFQMVLRRGHVVQLSPRLARLFGMDQE